jgi:hypothetical protein
MPVALVTEAPGMPAAVYDQIIEKVGLGPGNYPNGFISHYACDTGEGMLFFAVWETEDDWRSYMQDRLGPAIAEVTGGQGPAIEPRFYAVHREEHR